MSLRAFHIVFIVASVALTAFFALWAWPTYPAATIGCSVAVVFMLWYGVRFWQKTRIIAEAKHLAFLGAALLLAMPRSSWACSVCFGDPNSLQVQGMNRAIWVLLAVIAAVLVCVAWFMVHLARRARLVAAKSSASGNHY